MALALAERGADVAITYHSSADAAEEVGSAIRELGVRALLLRCDQRHEEEVRAAVDRVVGDLGGLDVLVNSASNFHRVSWDAIDAAAWDGTLSVNLRGPFLFARHATAALRARRGKIVNIADVAGLRPWTDYLPYSVAKAGVIALTQGLAKALAPEVTVNAIAPGEVLWPDSFSSDQREKLLRRIPLGRSGSAEDVVRTLLYLLEGSDYVTGAIIPVDGGRLLG
jgi:NAD(P)-dependent dehydrogenase (short-subunit alcohol dehydrogenase family)